MNKREALALKPGDRIKFGDHALTAASRWFRDGTVLHVTPRGGVRVRADGGGAMWAPYHHVVRKIGQ